MTIKNTFGYDPATNENFKFNLEPAKSRGQVMIEDGKVTKGEEVINNIKNNKNDTFLVSKFVFEYLVPLGYSNVCMFDPVMTEREDNGRVSSQGGLIFA